jgi:general nucleoside transport system permease protein
VSRSRFPSPWGAAALVMLTTLLALALLVVSLELAGADAALALRALWMGSFGSWDALTSATLVRATPLILTGLAVTIAFRAGVWNIGAEGQLLAGGAAATAIALSIPAAFGSDVGLVPLALALMGGALAGGIWAGIAAMLRHRYMVPDVIGTIMLNFIALHFVGYLVRGPLQEPSLIYPQSDVLAAAARLPRLIAGSRLHWGFVASITAAPLLHWVLRTTAWGFRLRASGANPRAARLAGQIDVARTTIAAFVLSGMLAGLAGASEVAGVTYALYENISPGYGYIAIAVALLARLEPLGVIVTGVLFGALEAGAVAMQREAGIPSAVVSAVEALLILALLAFGRWRGTLALPSAFGVGVSSTR